MPSVESSITVRGTREQVFDLTQDYSRRLDWDPFLRSADLLHGATTAAVGVQARCVAWYGAAMVTEYVTLERPAVAAVRMTAGPPLVAVFAGTWRFNQCTPETVLVTFRYFFTTRPSILAPFLNPIIAAWFQRDTKERLLSLQNYLEQSPT